MSSIAYGTGPDSGIAAIGEALRARREAAQPPSLRDIYDIPPGRDQLAFAAMLAASIAYAPQIARAHAIITRRRPRKR